MDDSGLRAITVRHGVFLRREATALGYDDRAIQRLLRSRAWVRVHHGCYAFPEQWVGRDEIERHRLLCRAVYRTHADDVVVSHVSSVLEHQVAVWGVELKIVHLTVGRERTGRCANHVRLHSGRVSESDVTTVNGVRATVLPRALVETACETSVEAGLVMVDSALNRGLADLPALVAAHAEMQHWPGARNADVAIRLARAGAQSPGESRCRYAFWQHGVPAPELQYAVWHEGELLGYVDFAWPEFKLFAEFDGRVKYDTYLRPGQTSADAVFREKRREERILEATGWRMIRVAWEDLRRPDLLADRILRMLRATA